MKNRQILKAAKQFGMIILPGGGYERGGAGGEVSGRPAKGRAKPGMWLFHVEFVDAPRRWDRSDGFVLADNAADAVEDMTRMRNYWFPKGKKRR